MNLLRRVWGFIKAPWVKKKVHHTKGPGSIYIFRHPSMPWRFYKIGMTTRCVHTRIDEWSDHYGVQVKLLGWWDTDDAFEVEQAIHEKLKSRRYKGKGFGKEFFKVSKRRAKRIIKNQIK